MSRDAGPAEGHVTVTSSHSGSFRQTIHAGHHELIGDEPEPIGGDAGPSPYDLLLGALGSCTSMTVRMYADRKNWPLNEVRVSLRHDRVHARDCANCETESGMVSRITRLISFDGDLDDEQRKRLLEIADRCPVHRTLSGEISIETTEQRA